MRFPEEVMWALTSQYVNVHNLFIYLFTYLSICLYNNGGRCARKVIL